MFGNDFPERLTCAPRPTTTTMDNAHHVGQVGPVADDQSRVGTFRGSPADELRERLPSDRRRALESTLKLRIKANALHPDSVSRSIPTVIRTGCREMLL